MEFLVRFEAGNRVLRASVEGDLTEQTLVDLSAEVKSLLESQLPEAILVDLSGVTSFQVANDVVRSFARMPSPLSKEIVRVVVAPQYHIYGVARMFQSYADGNRPNVHLVRSLEEAYRYLGRALAS